MFDASPLVVSLRSSLVATLIVFFLGIIAARACMNLHGTLAWIPDALFTLPMVLPPTVVGFILLVLFGRRGPLGFLDVVFTWKANVIAAAVVAFPLMYRSAKGAFQQIDPDHIWAARTLGMSEAEVLVRVMIPEAKPGILAGTALTFARALGEFGATLMLAGDIPGRTESIPTAIYLATAGGDMRTAWIWVLVITASSCIALAVMSLQERRK